MSQQWKPATPTRPAAPPRPAGPPGAWQSAKPTQAKAPPLGAHRQRTPYYPQIAQQRSAYALTADDLREFLTKVQEAPSGLKRLATDNRDQAVYRLEKLDPHHRFGEMMFKLLNFWHEHYRTAEPHFFVWVDMLTPDDVAYVCGQGFDELWARDQKGIRFVTDRVREQFRVVPVGGRACTRGSGTDPLPLTTSHARTAIGTEGAYLWVLDRWNGLYTAASELGRTHHSSFSHGRAIRGAGEWQVVNGQIRIVTGKTGHYRMPVEHLVHSLVWMRDSMRLDMRMARVEMYENRIHESHVVRIPVDDFLGQPRLQQQYSLFSTKRVVDGEAIQREMSQSNYGIGSASPRASVRIGSGGGGGGGGGGYN